jgi:hypothetical protein
MKMHSMTPLEFNMYVHKRVLVSAHHFPYLSLLMGPDRNFYFLQWVDMQTSITDGVWVFFPVTFEQMTAFNDKQMSLRSIMETTPWMLKFLGAPEIVTGSPIRWEEIPEASRPTKDSFWHEALQEE